MQPVRTEEVIKVKIKSEKPTWGVDLVVSTVLVIVYTTKWNKEKYINGPRCCRTITVCMVYACFGWWALSIFRVLHYFYIEY